MTRATFILATLGAAVSAQAHPGHGPLANGAAHFLTSPYHLAAALLLAGGLWLAAAFVKHRSVKIAFRTSGVVMAALSLILWGMGA